MMRPLNARHTSKRRAGLLAIVLCLFSLGQPGVLMARAELTPAGASGVDAARATQPAPAYVPGLAKQYGLTAADVPGFTMIKDPPAAQGQSYEGWMLAPDAKLEKGKIVLSNTDVSLIVTHVV